MADKTEKDENQVILCTLETVLCLILQVFKAGVADLLISFITF